MTNLEALEDAELIDLIAKAQTLLKQRDSDRKDKAMMDARSILAAAGLTMKDLQRAKPKTAKAAVYKGGRLYQHPSNKSLVWTAKGKKPGWLIQLEAEGKRGIEIEEAVKKAS